MPSATVSGIVLRSVNYRDNDRILTLLTPMRGRVEVLSRGCRRPKSPLMSASEVFCTGEFVLFAQRDKNLLTSCTVSDSFYPLRLSYGLLSCGVYLLNLCDAAVQPEEVSDPVFWLLVKTLHRLAYGKEDRGTLLSGFLFSFAVVLGYRPRLNRCVHCGRDLAGEDALLFDLENGGLCCPGCKKTNESLPITGRQANFLRTISREGPEASAGFSSDDAPFLPLRRYVEMRLEKTIKGGPILTED